MTTADFLRIDQSAADRIDQLLQMDTSGAAFLRIYVIGGGCSGFQYGFKFEKSLEPEDYVIDHITEEAVASGVQVVVDAMSAPYLEGATVKYVESLQGAHFTVENPNAKTTCGCGSSFSLD